jgi:hypothetical protein
MAIDLEYKKEHFHLDLDNSKMVRTIANKTGKSVTRVINEMLRMIGNLEEKTELTLKETTIESKNGKPPVKFKKNLQFSVKL